MKISIYTTLFQWKSNKFDFDSAIKNFLRIADEIVVATIEDEDGTKYYLETKAEQYPELKFIVTDLKRYTPTFDGALKNAALQACSGDVLIQLDADEKISVNNLDMWVQVIGLLMSQDDYQAAFIPSINLFGDTNHFSDIGQKWYIHKRGLFRGPVNFAIKDEFGHVDTNKSDTCELIDSDGNLVKTMRFFDLRMFQTWEESIEFIRQSRIPVVFHYGWIDLERRIDIIKNHWQKQWNAESGSFIEMPQTVSDINKNKIPHNLELP